MEETIKVQPTTKEVQPDPAASPPPSSTSSPSHEFSFAIALPPPPATPPPFTTTIDFSPADEIFFHGHLLPLHILSHHHRISSARSSTNSIESFITFTLNDELLHDLKNSSNDAIVAADDEDELIDETEGKTRARKSRSFSHLFPKWRKHHHHQHDNDHDHDHEHKQRTWRPRFDAVKRYMRLVKPYIHIPFVRHKRASGDELLLRHPATFNSYSGRLRVMSKSKKDSLVIRAGRRSEFSSAPVSIKPSPTNSGLLVATGNATPTPRVAFDESTVHEFQAAIQAAIAHCKKSVSAENGDMEQQDKANA